MAALIALVATSTSSAAPNLVHAGGGDYTPPDQRGINLSTDSELDRPTALVVAVSVCGVRDVHVDNLTLVHPDGLRLLDWGVSNARRAGAAGDAPTLTELGDYRSHEIRVRCAANYRADLGIEIERTATTSATTDGVDVHYRSAGETKTLTVWFGIALCGKDQVVSRYLDPTDTSDHAQVLRDCDGAD